MPDESTQTDKTLQRGCQERTEHVSPVATATVAECKPLTTTASRKELEDRVRELESVLVRCLVAAAGATTGDEGEDQRRIKKAFEVKLEYADDFVNDQFADLECRAAQAEAVLSDIPSWIIGKASAFVYMASAGAEPEDLSDDVAEVKGWLKRRQEIVNPSQGA